ncbi:jg21804 [Pararge aegeria aegeria]|uniref:Jg21804 protein n=1 Tax=Pararge aegeria aegeria TaxID=348720 RepID=A0A8S4QI00_9NEOP|nr:jg21804 [Pararge aegeria aegeria]
MATVLRRSSFATPVVSWSPPESRQQTYYSHSSGIKTSPFLKISRLFVRQKDGEQSAESAKRRRQRRSLSHCVEHLYVDEGTRGGIGSFEIVPAWIQTVLRHERYELLQLMTMVIGAGRRGVCRRNKSRLRNIRVLSDVQGRWFDSHNWTI